MKVLVTGADGFVGKHAVRDLRDRGHDVYGVDKKSGNDLAFIEIARRAVALGDPDVIVHLASSCSTPGSVDRPYETFRDTVMAAVNILEVARERKIPVVLTSSVKARDGMTPYGAAKSMVETWALEYRSAYRLPVIINRPGTIYGPGQDGSPESGWIAWFLKAKETGQQVVINGDGLQVRDLLHVSDYVNLLALQIKDVNLYNGMDRVFDVGGGNDNVVTIIDMARYLELDYVYGPERYGDSRAYIGLNNAPDWAPSIHWRESETFR